MEDKCPKCGAERSVIYTDGYVCGTHGDNQSVTCRIRELEAEVERLKGEKRVTAEFVQSLENKTYRMRDDLAAAQRSVKALAWLAGHLLDGREIRMVLPWPSYNPSPAIEILVGRIGLVDAIEAAMAGEASDV